ncbi:MAG: phosphodiesterase [Pseudomonadota bacterium]
MKIIHITDLHLPQPGEKLWGLDPYARFESALVDIETLHSDAWLCVISGDLTDRAVPQAYDWLANRLARFPFETVLMLGNHDDRATAVCVLPGLPVDQNGFVQTTIDLPVGRLLFLDTFKGGTSAGQYCTARQEWLRTQLAEAADRPVWIFMHHPPFDVGIAYMDRIKLEEGDVFGDIVEGSSVQHIFFGHIHRTCFVHWRGISCSSLPSLAHQVPLDRPALGTSYSIEPPMYGVINLSEDGMIVHVDAWADRAPAEMDW